MWEYGSGAFSGDSGGIWRDGRYLVAHRDAVFPDICVKSGLPAHGNRVRQIVQWHPGLVRDTAASPGGRRGCRALVSREATFEVGVSRRWLRKRLRGRVLGGIVIAGGLGAMVAAIAWMGRAIDQAMLLFVAGMFVMFAGLIYAMSANVLISARRMWQDCVWLRGVHRDFLACCPAWPGEDQPWRP